MDKKLVGTETPASMCSDEFGLVMKATKEAIAMVEERGIPMELFLIAVVQIAQPDYRKSYPISILGCALHFATEEYENQLRNGC